jgi:hypothetical protein
MMNTTDRALEDRAEAANSELQEDPAGMVVSPAGQ